MQINLLDQLLSKDPLQLPPQVDEIWSPKIETDNSGTVRLYKTPDGNFPSVTSVLGATEDTSWLEQWKSRVGEEKAEEISQRSRDRGTRMHSALEAAIRREDYFSAAEHDVEALIMARRIAEKLFPRVDKVLAMEAAVWSTRLKIAGRLDMAGLVDGKPTIVDYKNSRRPKDKIDGYFMQASLYAMMIYERTGIPFNNVIIAIGLADDHLGNVQIFESEIGPWIIPALDRIKSYKLCIKD